MDIEVVEEDTIVEIKVDIVVVVAMTGTAARPRHTTGGMSIEEDPDLDPILHVSYYFV